MEKINIIKFKDFNNMEYRKGSNQFGALLTKLMDFLRMYDKGDMVFTIENFVKESNININEINQLIKAKENGNNLYLFNIEIKGDNIYFTNFINGKSRPFESNNII